MNGKKAFLGMDGIVPNLIQYLHSSVRTEKRNAAFHNSVAQWIRREQIHHSTCNCTVCLILKR